MLDCGHEPTPSGIGTGYARMPNGETLCYDCADNAQREDLKTATRYFAYLSSDDSHVITWSGGTLGHVTYLNRNRRQTFIRMRDVHGRMWAGIGPSESGTYVSLRRIKGDR
jgi:hypothetical protein